MTPFSLAEFAGYLLTIDADLKIAEEVAVTKATEMVEKEAKRVIGTYDYGWPQLAPATQQDRVRHGYDANKPLLRAGEMRDSIERVSGWEGDEYAGYVGTNHPVAKFHEYGTARIPPRPFISSAAIYMEPKIYRMMERTIATTLGAGGPNFHNLRLIMHAARWTYERLKEAVPDED